MTIADDYNAKQLASGALTMAHVTTLVRAWQDAHGLTADGMAGSATLRLLGAGGTTALTVDANGWLVGPGVTVMSADPSWYGGLLIGKKPAGIVAHYTATDPGTAIAMAKRRSRRFGLDPDDRAASWHLSIEADGAVMQMVPLNHQAWHVGSPSAAPVPGVGWGNQTCIGIELVGWGKTFPLAQVAAARTVWRALVAHYGIAREHAMITHQSIDPSRRDDPGPVWMAEHAPGVLVFAYA